ncbi:hypothetical protein DLREEDagrD3_13120 [Denitratisoma sp. agr-D3]
MMAAMTAIALPATPPLDRPDSALWRDQLMLLLESTGEGIYCIDLNGRCTYINRAGAELLRYRPEQVLGRNMHYLIHHAHADGRHYPVDECPIFHAFQQGQPCRVDTDPLWRSDGSGFHAEYSSYPIVENGVIKGAVVTFVDITERKRTEEALRQARNELERRVEDRTAALSAALEQLRELSAHLETVREEERIRIAREVHDELGSLLVALKMDTGWLGNRLADRPELLQKSRAMARLIDTAVVNVGRIITDLRPSILDHQGLWAALEWQAQEFAEASELACDIRMEIAPDAPEPEGACATAVFRIFQEILSNIARHAHARSVGIQVEADARALTVDIADDGIGAREAELNHPRSYGVLGMGERARHFGGELTIHGEPGRGTRVCLRLPLTGNGGEGTCP